MKDKQVQSKSYLKRIAIMKELSELCPKCKTLKQLDEFYKDITSKRVHSSWCRICIKKHRKSRYENNKTHILQQQQQYRLNHPNIIKTYKLNNKEKIRKYSHDYNRTLKYRFRSGICKAEQRQLDWELTLEQYKKLVSQLCFYCDGALPTTGVGLDRKNNVEGYTISNVVPCCAVCNTVKSNIFTSNQILEIKSWLIKCRKSRVN